MDNLDIIKVNNIDLIYRTAESLSVKKALKMLFRIGDANLLNKYKALSNISCTIKKGKVYGVIGNNGAGKSTLLRILSGVMSPNSGNVERNYKTINLLALGIGFSKELTGYDNIYLNGLLLGFSKQQIREAIQNIIDYSEIGDFIYKPMKTYSSGMISRLGFSIAINLKPEVLLIDEVLSVGDVRFRQKSFESIKSIIRDNNVTVVIVSHGMVQIKDLCDYVIWLDKGKMIAQGETDSILDLYSQYNEGKLTIKEIYSKNLDSIEKQNNEIKVDCSDYSIRMFESEEKKFFEKTYDYIQTLFFDNMNVKITKRVMPNSDTFLYFEIENTEDSEFNFIFDNIENAKNFDYLYKKPPYDKRYGESKTTGLSYYLDLLLGSAIISKLYYYKKLEKKYDENSYSELFELNKEENKITQIEDNKLKICIDKGYEKCSFFVLISKGKLFRDEDNLIKYMEYHYKNVFNNNVWSSFFMLPSGTYTKLPYSIEPFTKEGYGFSFHHSSRKDLFPFFMQTNERFFSDMINNAILQVYMYQKSDKGVLYTPYTSTWLKSDTNIVAPYIDTRLNETFIHMLQDYLPQSPFNGIFDPLRDYVEFLIRYYEEDKPIYKIEGGIFFPDYFKENLGMITHSSLNHQLGTASLFKEAFCKYEDARYLDMFRKIINFVSSTWEEWIIPENKDLYYGIKYEKNGKLIFYGQDYIYVTLIDLMFTQIFIGEVMNGKRIESIDNLILSKIDYLKTTKYNPFSDESVQAPGESINSKDKVRELFSKLFNEA